MNICKKIDSLNTAPHWINYHDYIIVVTVFRLSFKGKHQINTALFRPATQSSTYGGSTAHYAVDGGCNSWSTTSYSDLTPWWKVQLTYPIWVTQVEINYHDSAYIFYTKLDTIGHCECCCCWLYG